MSCKRRRGKKHRFGRCCTIFHEIGKKNELKTRWGEIDVKNAIFFLSHIFIFFHCQTTIEALDSSSVGTKCEQECQRTRANGQAMTFYNKSHSYFIDYCLFSDLHCFETRKYVEKRERETRRNQCEMWNTEGASLQPCKNIEHSRGKKRWRQQEKWKKWSQE